MSYVIQGKRKLIIPTSTSDQKEVSYIFGSRSSRSPTIPFHNHKLVQFLELIFSGCFSWSKFIPYKWLIPPNWKKTNKMTSIPLHFIISLTSIPLHSTINLPQKTPSNDLWLPGCAERTHIHPFTASKFTQFSLKGRPGGWRLVKV